MQAEPDRAAVRGDVLVAGVSFAFLPAGALYWPEEGLLAVADLHLEKGSAYAARGVLLPPYDTTATLAALGRLVATLAPRTVIALGDSFHDDRGPMRLGHEDRLSLAALQRGRTWIWVAGNHDPGLQAADVGGDHAAEITVGPIVFRHEPAPEAEGEIAGHLHPVARIRGYGRGVRRRCFATDGRRAVLPAFGAYAGGLNLRDPALAGLFEAVPVAHVLGEGRVYPVAFRRCLPD